MINEYKILSFFGITKDIIFPKSAGLSKDEEYLMEKYLFSSIEAFVQGDISFNELKNEFFPDLDIDPSVNSYTKMNDYIKSL